MKTARESVKGTMSKMARTSKSTTVKVKVQSSMQTLPRKMRWQKCKSSLRPGVFYFLSLCVHPRSPSSTSVHGLRDTMVPDSSSCLGTPCVCMCAWVFLTRAEKDVARPQAAVFTGRDPGASETRCAGATLSQVPGPLVPVFRERFIIANLVLYL